MIKQIPIAIEQLRRADSVSWERYWIIELLQDIQERDKMDKDLVIFRKWKDDGEILALFPELEGNWGLCTCFSHVGQHATAEYHYCLSLSKPATPEEYADLQKELEDIGYNLKIRKRWNRA